MEGGGGCAAPPPPKRGPPASTSLRRIQPGPCILVISGEGLHLVNASDGFEPTVGAPLRVDFTRRRGDAALGRWVCLTRPGSRGRRLLLQRSDHNARSGVAEFAPLALQDVIELREWDRRDVNVARAPSIQRRRRALAHEGLNRGHYSEFREVSHWSARQLKLLHEAIRISIYEME